MTGAEIGRVVLSRAGRDKGRYFAVVALIDHEHVALCDGDTRKVLSPKKKKIKHLTPRPELISSIAAKIGEGKRIEDHEVRASLASLGYARTLKAGGKGMEP